MKPELLAHISQEIRQPLNTITGLCELLYAGRVGTLSGAQREYLADVLDSARTMMQVVNDVSQLAAAETGQIEVQPEVVDVERLVTEMRSLLTCVAVRKQIRIQAALERDLPRVVADASKLRQVLYALLMDAIAFTPRDGEVTVRALLEGTDRYRIEVEGGAADVAVDGSTRPFAPIGYAVDTKRRLKGTGLAMALTKRLVEAQGGEVGACMVGGIGPVFYAVLPLTVTGTLEGSARIRSARSSS